MSQKVGPEMSATRGTRLPEIEIKDLEAEREEIVRSLPQTD